jgi:pseudaminic acid cytidylyltransferase
MKSICVIPARGGSKRIPRKNIKLFHGKPLIAWSIEVATSSALFDAVYVSTDDEEIANVAKEYGAIVPFLRPEQLSNDFAGDKEVREHFIEWMKENMVEADILCYLYATAPFVTEKTLKGCQQLLLDSGAISAHTVTTYAYPVLRSLKRDEQGLLDYMWKEYATSRSQDLPELLHDAGQCYFFNLNKYGKGESRVGYEIPRLHCQDIDTVEDFETAEKLFKLLQLI